MMLKYSDDKVTDEEMWELNLQTAVQQYMMQDAQNKTTPLHCQQSQSLNRCWCLQMIAIYHMDRTLG